MLRTPSPLDLISALLFTLPGLLQGPAPEPFPASTALAEGVSPEALERLDQLVAQLVVEDDIVGAELLVIVHGKAILHEAYGWADREAERPMETGSVFCVRSMTKPLIGAAVQMLIADGAFSPGDRVAEYLPSFDVEGSRDITVEHLLHHTSGLPMSLILGRDLAELEAAGGIRAVADLGAGHELEFEPGTDFRYSDQGTDTLTALIEVTSGMTAAEFVRSRVLDPIGMQDTVCVLEEGLALRERALPKYVGAAGAWTRFWTPDGAPLFPFFLGSQGLYSTLEDYARFAQVYANRGRVGKQRLLSSRAVRKTLEPGPYPLGGPTGLPGLRTDYGYLMQLWTGEDDEGEREVVAFGHTGSDGTHAWVFPEQDAMVLYFTQSRGTTTGLRVEEVLGDLFLGVPFDPNQVAPPFDPYLGYYLEPEDDDLYRAIIRDGEDLALEIMGRGVVPLTYVGEDRWKFRSNPSKVIEFERDAAGAVTGFFIGEHYEARLHPAADLPSADELCERVVAAHRIDLTESLGPVRLVSDLDMEKLGIEGEVIVTLAWPDLIRVDTVAGDNFEHVSYDGEHVRYSSSTQPVAELDGMRAEQVRRGSSLVRLGDWRHWFDHVEVIQRVELEGREMFLVRAGDTSAPGRTYYVEGETGIVRRELSMTFVETLGRLGQRLTFGDYRDVAGMQLPHKTTLELAYELIGPIVTTVTSSKVGVELSEDAFVLEE